MSGAVAEISLHEQARRLRILEWLLYVCGGIVLILGLFLLILAGDISASVSPLLLTLVAIFFAIIVAWVVARLKWLVLATHIFFVTLTLAAIRLCLPDGVTGAGMYSLFIPIVGANLLLGPRWSWVYAGAALIATLAIELLSGVNLTTPSIIIFNMLMYGGYFIVVALLSYMAAQGYEEQLSRAQQHAAELQQVRTELEDRVAERTRDTMLALEELRQNAEVIQQLSAPILPVADAVLAVPMMGHFDTKRAEFFTEQLLAAINRERARIVLLDVTGMSSVDTEVASALIRAGQAVRLLGAEPILVGIRAEVAQMFVSLGIDLGGLISLRDLRSGIAYALNRLELQEQQAASL